MAQRKPRHGVVDTFLQPHPVIGARSNGSFLGPQRVTAIQRICVNQAGSYSLSLIMNQPALNVPPGRGAVSSRGHRGLRWGPLIRLHDPCVQRAWLSEVERPARPNSISEIEQ